MKKKSFQNVFVVLISIFFASCSSDNKDNENISNKKIDGQELFKSIIFLDGQLTKKIPSLESISNVNNLSVTQLVKFRKSEIEAINYLKKLDSNYFNKFQSNIYTKDPEIIGITIKKASKDMESFLDSKLSLKKFLIEKISRNTKKDKSIRIDVGETQIGMKQLCLDNVMLLMYVNLITASVAVVNNDPFTNNQVNMEAISLQIAKTL